MMQEHWEFYRQNIVETLSHVNSAEQIVAEHGNRIVGTALLYPTGTVQTLPDGTSITLAWPEMRLLAVPPASRRQGIGTALTR